MFIYVTHNVKSNDKQSRRTRALEFSPGLLSGEAVLFLHMENGNPLSIYSSPNRLQTLQTPRITLCEKTHLSKLYVLGGYQGECVTDDLYIFLVILCL